MASHFVIEINFLDILKYLECHHLPKQTIKSQIKVGGEVKQIEEI